MSPEHCDDIKIRCNFERTPSFYYLKEAYTKLTPDWTITIDTFEVDHNRLGPSLCPSNFPPLDSFIWATDNIHDLKCPSKDISNVCNLVQAKSIFIDLLQIIPLVIFLFLSIGFCMKRTLTGRYKLSMFSGNRKAAGQKMMGHNEGESETLISSSMSIDKNYESTGNDENNPQSSMSTGHP